MLKQSTVLIAARPSRLTVILVFHYTVRPEKNFYARAALIAPTIPARFPNVLMLGSVFYIKISPNPKLMPSNALVIP